MTRDAAAPRGSAGRDAAGRGGRASETGLVDAAMQLRLLHWYRRHRRDLPWRRDADPYRVWVSEVMLQQTTVRTVVPYFEAFVARFPSPEVLAAAAEADVVAAWSGLGYYHRARNLLRGAQHVVRHHDGRFPGSLDAAVAVPGVGLYTASAVLSIAYGLPLPVVDGNVRRVLARLLCLIGPKWLKDGPYYAKAEELLDRRAPGDWNQALMELGATLCTPRRPACDACPVRDACRGRAQGLVERLPEGRARRAPVEVAVAAAVVERDGRLLLVRREEGRLLSGMWEVPQTSLDAGGPPDLVGELARRHGLRLEPGPLLLRARHAITFRRLRVEAYRARILGRPPRDGDRYLWATPAEVEALPVSSLTRKIVRGLSSAQLPLAL